jgi:diguanylate cyclase (GGDEF)-like protein
MDQFGDRMSDLDDKADKTSVLGVKDLLQMQAAQKNAYLIVINGRSVGRMYKVSTTDTVMGRSPDVDVIIEDEGVSRQHAKIENREDGMVLMDMGSTNGIFVNGKKVKRHYLNDGDRLQIGSTTILKFSYQDELEENFQKQLYDSATRDALTGAYNKKFFADHLKTEFAFCYRHERPLSLILFDIDFFKKVNDNFGHVAGDYALKEVSKLVLETLRTEDLFARYGGEEFGVILRDTDAEHSFLIAERVRRTIEAFKFMWEGDEMPVTISLGVATLIEKNHRSPKALVQAADEYLYKAKENGRNRCESALMS